MSTILITGGSGLIGSRLTAALRGAGHEVRHLSRSPRDRDGVRVFAWDPSCGTIDPAALKDVEVLVHLSGAPIADKRWTRSHMKEMDDSRAGAARLLRKAVRDHGVQQNVFISASGSNYYGAITSDHVFTENDPSGQDIIGQLTTRWEAAADAFADLCRVVKLRQPIVLAREGGALPRMAKPVKWTISTLIGSGRQWWPWVHIDDLVRIYLQAIADDRMQGSYNVNASEQVTNEAFMRALARATKRPFVAIPIPGVLIRLAMGEGSAILLHGSRTSNARLLGTGFRFQHDAIEPALRGLLQ